MKFGKLLQDLIGGNPQMSEQPLIRYKELKKHLKSIKKQQEVQQDAEAGAQHTASVATAAAVAEAAQQQLLQEEGDDGQPQELPADLSAEEHAFVNMLNEDLCGFNRFFMDKEEDAVIKLQALADRIQAAQDDSSSEEMQELKAALVDFHGEMVLLLHWSLLNYAAVVKILKKHDKQSGLLLRAPYLANVLQQPFYSTSIMSRLVKMAEGHIESLVAQEAKIGAAATAAAAGGAAPDAQAAGSNQQPAPGPAAAPAEASEPGPGPSSAAAAAAGVDEAAAAAAAAAGGGAAGAEAGAYTSPASSADTGELLEGTAVCARTRVALQTWQQLCSNASTPSTVLPPNSSQALVRALNVRQRWAQLVGMAPIMQRAGMAAGDAGVQQQEGSGQVDAVALHEEGGGVMVAAAAAGQMAEHTGGRQSSLAGQKHEAAGDTSGAAAEKRQKVDS